MANISITFPGQGSQSVGMLADLAAAHGIVRQTFEEASDALGLDLWGLSQNGPKEDLNRTENTQPALLAAGMAVWRVWSEQNGVQPINMAGHSLGEYTALVASGAMQFGDAVRLVQARGQFMQEAVPAGEGAMAAILGLDDDAVAKACADAAQGEVVSAVNFNSPGQVVIAGNRAAVDRAMALARDSGAKRALPLDVSVPSHCALMQGAADRLAAELAAIDVTDPEFPVIHNVSVAMTKDPDEIRSLLQQQLYSPVRWVETVQAIRDYGVDLVLEFGPGKVLTGLAKRIDKSLGAMAVLDPKTLDAALEAANDA